MIKKYNLSKPEKYIDKQGVEKTFWANVGTMTEFEKQDGSVSRIVEIPAIGLKASVFLQEPRENTSQRPKPRFNFSDATVSKKEVIVQLNDDPNVQLDVNGNEINADDIPF